MRTTEPETSKQGADGRAARNGLRGVFRFGSLTGVVSVLAIIFVIASITSEYFLTEYNITIIIRAVAFVGLITIGQAILMMMGELDLSLGAIAGLVAVAVGILIVEVGINPWLGVALGALMGIGCGLLNGALVAFLRLHSLVLTIGMAGVYGGANLVVTEGVAITGIPAALTDIGRGTLFGMPVPFVLMLVVLVVVTLVIQRTPLGRYVYAIGNNSDAARMLGIRVDQVRIIGFSFAGLLAGLAGMMMMARLGTAQPSIGQEWVLAPIAAAVIGGVATTGGTGSPFGAVLGAFIIGIISNIIVLLGVSPYWQGIVSGAIVVIAISVDSTYRRTLGR